MRNRNELTDLEKRILGLIAQGFEYRDIAEQLNISVSVVQNRVVYIMFKLNANNRTHAVVNALRQNVITIDSMSG